MLTLPIKKQWFDMILSGEKKEEYRNITPRYTTMFANASKDSPEFLVKLRNGYSSTSPTAICRVACHKGYGKEQWGAEPNTEYFVLSILSVEK